ncbi:MAG TPA: adenosylmethionine--8-amino-7-oxononanoate transaminase [Polyangiaceae bacterium]|nr:adenosylmethionine--8-amino-7-oxononanoate transaminase [Polyangiaceae bacterium]
MATSRFSSSPSRATWEPPSWLTRGAAHVWRPYCQHGTAPPPFPVATCHGTRLVLADGRELVDGTASWWTAAHGYRHPHIIARVEEQLHRLPHVAFGGLAHEAAYTLAERLSSLFPPTLRRVFFVESGSVAVEVAVKMALQSFHNRGAGRRRRVVAFDGAYHGDTFATMALGDPVTGMHRAFTGLGLDVLHWPIPVEGDSFEHALASVAAETACVVIEPLVQCAGGMRFHDAAVLQRIRQACSRCGVLLVFDEIATGFYRTGARFALDEAGVAPDIVVVGKALTGGTLPLAAAIASEEVFDAFSGETPERALQHGPTFMGNALACAAAHASLDLFAAPDIPMRVRRLEATLRAGLWPLRSRRHVRDVRIRGAIGVVEMAPGTAPASVDFARHGAFVRPLRLAHADVLYLMPSLAIDDTDVAILLSALEACLV